MQDLMQEQIPVELRSGAGLQLKAQIQINTTKKNVRMHILFLLHKTRQTAFMLCIKGDLPGGSKTGLLGEVMRAMSSEVSACLILLKIPGKLNIFEFLKNNASEYRHNFSTPSSEVSRII